MVRDRLFTEHHVRFVIALLSASVSVSSASADMFEYRDQNGARQTVEARLAGTGGGWMALELADGTWQLIPERAIQRRIPGDGPTPLTAAQALEQLVEEFGEDKFRGMAEDPYVIGLILSDPLEKRDEVRATAFLKKAVAFMKNVESVFLRFMRDMRIESTSPKFPLVLLVFESDDDFEEFNAEETQGQGLSAARTAGYYSGLTNRLVIRMGECHTFETPLHEAVHQQVHNRGLMQRLAPVPAWFHEGLATGFENNGDRINAGPLRVSSHYGRMVMSTQVLGWHDVIQEDRAFQGDILAGEAYAHAWALHWYLASKYPDEYREYFQKLAALPPFADSGKSERIAEFEATFGKSIPEFEQDFPPTLAAALKKQRLTLRDNSRAGVLVTQSGLAEIEVRAVRRPDIGGILQVDGRLRNISSIRPMSFYVVVETNTGTFADWYVSNVGTFKYSALKKQVVGKVLPGAPGGLSQSFRVRVECAVPGSDVGKEWENGRLPVPNFGQP